MSRVVFMGTPAFSVPALEWLASSGHEIVGVYTQPDRPAGRGRIPTASSVKKWASDHGLAAYQPATLRQREAVVQMQALRPEVIVVAAYGKLLPEAVLTIPLKGTLNIHPSLLPRYRGASPVASALMEGEVETGVTIMLADSGVDTGPIVSQRPLSIDRKDTAGTLGRRLADLGAELLSTTIEAWLSGGIQVTPQDDASATTTGRLKKEDGEIAWGLPATLIERRVRGLHPWPGCFTRWQGGTLKILEADVAPGSNQPGLVEWLEEAPRDRSICVSTGEGSLVLRTVQPEGKRPMTAKQFAAGHPNFVGSLLQD